MIKNLKNANILFLEDNMEFAQNTIKLIKLYSQNVFHVVSIKDALECYEKENIDVIISDLKVEDGIALEFIEKVRAQNVDIPIVILSAHTDENFLLKAIPLNIALYGVKPIDFDEFENILKKCAKMLNNNKIDINADANIFYDKLKKVILKDNESIDLNKKELDFIELLIKNKNGITTKDNVAEVVWENSTMTDAALKNFFLRLRKKVGNECFVTVHNVGYKLP